MADLDLRRLRYFVVLAGTLNFGRAAAALHIAQPALSRAVATLERELGARLFERSRAGVRLTAAGSLLLEEAPALLRSAEALRRRVRGGGAVTIGFMPGLIVTPLVRHLERRFPGLAVEVVRTSWTTQISDLREGRFDACLAHRPFAEAGLTVVELWSERRVVALPATHPYAGKPSVSVADLAGEVLLQPAAAVPGWPFPSAGTPVAASPTVEEKFEKVAAGRGIVIVPESATRYYRRPDLTFAPVADLPEARVCLVTEEGRPSPVLQELTASAPGLLGG